MKFKKNSAILLASLLLIGTVSVSAETTDLTEVQTTTTPIYEVQETNVSTKIGTTYEINVEDYELIDATEEDLAMDEIALNPLSRVTYPDVTLINNQSTAFTNYGGTLFSVPANTYTQFYYVLPSTGAYYEMGYIDGNGKKRILVDNKFDYGYVDFRVKFFEDTEVKFYLKNTQSDPITFKNIKFNFPV